MELKFNEIDNLGDKPQNIFNMETYDNYNERESKKYWENVKKVEGKRKKVSFDDILCNMNLVVNQNGVLQYMSHLPEPEPEPEYIYNSPNQYKDPLKKIDPLDPNVKHSYIFNKYFKDYKDTNSVTNIPAPRVPQSIEEYKQMLLQDKIKAIQEKNRIAQVKSTKMLYTNNISNTGHINTTANLKANPNRSNLRRMSFM